MKIFDKELAPGVHVKVEIVDAKLQLVLSGDAELVAAKAKEIIKGEIDDVLIDAALKVLKAATPA